MANFMRFDFQRGLWLNSTDGGQTFSDAANGLLKGTLANRPAAGLGRRFYFATDTAGLFYDNGTAWVPIGGGGNADTLDGQDGTYYLARANHTGTQAPATISPQGAGSGLGADTLDGYHAGNASGNVPVSNGTLCTNLNADKVDGYDAGNASGNVPVSNGTLCTNLNADKLDGKDSTAFVQKAGDTMTGKLAIKFGATTDSSDQFLIGRSGSPASGNPEFVFRIHASTPLITAWNGTSSVGIYIPGSFYIGEPTGGDKGYGTLNAKAVYDDGTLLTCYVLEAELKGAVDVEKWNGLVPKGKTIDGEEIVKDHKPAKRFAKRALDLLDPAKYSELWHKNGFLPSMPDDKEWKAHDMKMPLGDLVQRLWETVECQAVHIDKLLKRIERLEAENDRLALT